MNVYSRIVR